MHYSSSVLLLLLALSGTWHVSKAGGGSVTNKPNGETTKTNKPKIQMLQSLSPALRPDPDNPGSMIDIEPEDDLEDGKWCRVGELTTDETKCEVHPLVVAYMEEDIGIGKRNHYDIHAAVSLDEGNTWKRINLSNNVKRITTYSGRHCFTGHSEDDGDHDHSDGGRRLHEEEEPVTFEFNGDNSKPMIVAKGNKILVAWPSKNCKGGVPQNQGVGDGPYGGNEDDLDPQNKLGVSDRQSDRQLVKGSQRCHDYTSDEFGSETGIQPFKCVWAARGKVEDDGTIRWTKPERITSGRRDAFQLVAAVAGNQKAWALAWQEDVKGLRVGEAAGPGDGMSGATVNHKTDIWYSYLPGGSFDGWDYDPESSRWNIADGARFSSPVRVTDNAACKIEEVEDENGEPITVERGAPYCHEDDFCEEFVLDPVYSDKIMKTCKTTEGILLNGDTGASRPNMFLLPEGSSARVVLAYEESKGLGKGPGDNHAEGDETQAPAEREDWGKNIYYHTFMYNEPDEFAHGTMINLPELDENNEPSLTEDKTEYTTLNARRVRMIVQPAKNRGESGLAMVLLYREGEEGHGHPAHIVMRRFVDGFLPDKNLECTKTRKHPISKKDVCVEGSFDLNAENTPDEEAEYDDARAHRGFLRGDMLVLGYIYTPKWGRGFPKRYDFFVRRSFDGGKKWTDANGNKEGPRNLSNMLEKGNPGWSVMEPRLYATPGTMSETGLLSDVQNNAVFYAAYSTTHNPHTTDDEYVEGEKDEPLDLFWTMTDNFGESYMQYWNAIAGKWQYPWLARVHGGENDDAGFAGAQIRTNPGGTKLFATFQADVLSSTSIESGGGPCRGNGIGSDVCSNSTSLGDTFLARFDVNGDGMVDDRDEKAIQEYLENYDKGIVGLNMTFDLNGDNATTGQDLKLFPMAKKEFDKRPGSRRAYLRGRQ